MGTFNENDFGLDKIFDNHELFNKYQVFGGNRVNESGTKPSIYITSMKLKRALRELNHRDIEEVIDEEEDSEIAIERIRKGLYEKIEEGLHDWQLLKALNILMGLGRIEAITFVNKCKLSDEKLD